MSGRIKIISLLFLFLASMFACKKEKDEVSDLTPYPLSTPEGFPQIPIPAENPLTVEGVALGKKLFFDPILSGDNTMSCGSCHKQGFAFTDSTNQFSTGITKEQGDRNSMALINLAWETPFFWDGGAPTMEDQVLGPISNPLEMHQNLADLIDELNAHPEYPALFKKVFKQDKITSKQLMFAIAQFERTLVSANSRYDKWVRKEGGATLTDKELRGLSLYEDETKGDCFHCHPVKTLFTDFEFRNTGLDSITKDPGRYRITFRKGDEGKFKTPTLRNIEKTAPYMHDGRFKTLEEVLEFYNTGFHYHENLDKNLALAKKGRLTEQDKQDIIAFLKTLTDEEFLTNPKFVK